MMVNPPVVGAVSATPSQASGGASGASSGPAVRPSRGHAQSVGRGGLGPAVVGLPRSRAPDLVDHDDVTWCLVARDVALDEVDDLLRTGPGAGLEGDDQG